MLKLDFGWALKQTNDKKTVEYINNLKKELKRKNYLIRMQNGTARVKNDIILVSPGQKFPAKLRKWNLWFNKENEIGSLDTFLELFKDRAHQQLPGFPSKNDRIIIDLGGNEGYFTLAALEKAPKAKIIAVEANPVAFKILKKNMQANKLKVKLVNSVVSEVKGRVNFEIVKGVTAIGGLRVQGKRSWLAQEYVKKVKLNSTTLEEICKRFKIKKIDLLKIDIEGGEFRVLKSSKKLLKNIKKIVVEVHSPKLRSQVKNLLRSNGFTIALEEKRSMGDIYFIKKTYP